MKVGEGDHVLVGDWVMDRERVAVAVAVPVWLRERVTDCEPVSDSVREREMDSVEEAVRVAEIVREGETVTVADDDWVPVRVLETEPVRVRVAVAVLEMVPE